jgi:Spy/CpxP family protein refolding chaperone
VNQPEFAGMAFGVYAPDRLVDRREALALTPEQVSQLEALAQEARAVRVRTDSAARSHQEQLRTLWEADVPDFSAIETQMQAAHALRGAEHLAAARAAARAKAILTPEQRGWVDGWRDGAGAMGRRGLGLRPGRPGRLGRDGRPGWPGMGHRRR